MQTDEIPPIEHNGNTIYQNKGKADIFNNFFADQSPLQNSDDIPPTLPQSDFEMNSIELTETEVKKRTH